jgi:hypothetical protein
MTDIIEGEIVERFDLDRWFTRPTTRTGEPARIVPNEPARSTSEPVSEPGPERNEP